MDRRRAIELHFRSRLAAERPVVWAQVSTMSGVNDELRPWVRMSWPHGSDSLDQLVDGAHADGLCSWLLALGVVPFDRHRLVIERVISGVGFDEESSSGLQRRWRHERRVQTDPAGGCVVDDRLVVAPRRALPRPVVAGVVRLLFDHRHRRLRRRFGVHDAADDPRA